MENDVYNNAWQEDLFVIPYDKCALPFFAHIVMGVIAYAAGVVVLWLFYRLIPLALIMSLFVVPFAVYANVVISKKKRLNKLIGQFQSFLESVVVSLQAGGTDLGAFEHAIEDLELMYSARADMVKEAKLIVRKFANHITIGEGLMDFAERCALEDVRIFASVYSSVEGKGDRTREIVIRTQKILSDKIAIQQEIKTIISGASMEINIIAVIPVFIVAVMGFMGGDLMDGLFTGVGRIVATIALILFAFSYWLGKKIANIKV